MAHPELEALALRHLPERFLRALTEVAFLARRTAWEECASFANPEAQNLRPYVCRAHLEGSIRGAAERNGLESRVLKEPGQPWNHTEVVSGPIVLTAASVPTPLAPVDRAEYREGYARSNQLYLESLGQEPPGDAPLYVLFLHSRSLWPEDDQAKFGHLPGSVHLAFPASDLGGYVHDINLIDRFPEVVKKYVPQDWDSEAVVRYVAQARKTAFK